MSVSRPSQKRRSEVQIKCSKCGAENWLENQSKCLQCGAVLRRCLDCANYQRTRQWCTSLDTDIELREAEQPSALASSVNCPKFNYRGPSV
jgi:hypothetical protein